MERGESLREPGMPGMKGSGLVRSLPSVCVQGECVRPRSVGGVDTVVSSLEIFGLCGHLGLSELLRDNGEDAQSIAWMVQEGKDYYLLLAAPLVLWLFGGYPVEVELAISLLLCVGSISFYFQTSGLLEASWITEQNFLFPRGLCPHTPFR